MKGEVVQEGRSVNVVLKDNSSRLFQRSVIRLGSTKRYKEDEEEELSIQLLGTGLEARSNHKLVETMREPMGAKHVHGPGGAEPRRSKRLATKRVSIRMQEETHDPEQLLYYMEVVEQGIAIRAQCTYVNVL